MAEKFHSLPSASFRTRKTGVMIHFKSEVLRIGQLMCQHSPDMNVIV